MGITFQYYPVWSSHSRLDVSLSFIFLFLFLAVWVPCCTSDRVFLSFVCEKEKGSGFKLYAVDYLLLPIEDKGTSTKSE